MLSGIELERVIDDRVRFTTRAIDIGNNPSYTGLS
jgi:hypothetical protein